MRLCARGWLGKREGVDMSNEGETATLLSMNVGSRGEQLRARRERHGMSVHNFSAQSGVDRKTISRAEADDPKVTDLTYTRLNKALDEFEADTGAAPGEPGAPVKFRISGVYGVAEVIVEGPVENLPELEAAVERLLLRAQGKGDAQ